MMAASSNIWKAIYGYDYLVRILTITGAAYNYNDSDIEIVITNQKVSFRFCFDFYTVPEFGAFDPRTLNFNTSDTQKAHPCAKNITC